MTEASRNERVAWSKRLLESGDYSDLVITCGEDTYKVHKAIVCSQSAFFKKCAGFGGKESNEGVLDLPDDDPDIVKLMVQYLYEGEYDPPLPAVPSMRAWRNTSSSIDVSRHLNCHYEFPHTRGSSCSLPRSMVCHHHMCGRACKNDCFNFICPFCTCEDPPFADEAQLLLHSQIYTIANKKELAGLCQLAQEKFTRACTKFWNHEAFLEAAEHALSGTLEHDEGLRKPLREVFALKFGFLEKAGFEELLGKHPAFAFSVMKR